MNIECACCRHRKRHPTAKFLIPRFFVFDGPKTPVDRLEKHLEETVRKAQDRGLEGVALLLERAFPTWGHKLLLLIRVGTKQCVFG